MQLMLTRSWGPLETKDRATFSATELRLPTFHLRQNSLLPNFVRDINLVPWYYPCSRRQKQNEQQTP